MIRRALGVAVLAALVLAGIAVFEPRSEQPPEQVSTPEGSDYYMLDAVVTQFDRQGERRYRLTSDKSLHFPDESARLTDIRVDYRGGERGDWTLTAARGRVPASSRDILLTGDVTLERAPDAARPLTVKTPRAWVRTEAGRAETEAAVRARSPGRRVRGDGMTVEFDQETLKLHRDVRVTYTP